jgi:hypothetical protein
MTPRDNRRMGEAVKNDLLLALDVAWLDACVERAKPSIILRLTIADWTSKQSRISHGRV